MGNRWAIKPRFAFLLTERPMPPEFRLGTPH